MRKVIVVLVMCFVAVAAQATLVQYTINVSADTYINSGAPFTNYGDADYMQTNSIEGSYQKCYVKLDASGLPEIDSVVGDTLQAFYTRATKRTSKIYLLTGSGDNGDADSWDEDTITWLNAPGNDMSSGYNDMGTLPEGYAATYLGGFWYSDIPYTNSTVTARYFYAAQREALLNELNTGDRIATLVLISYGSSEAIYETIEGVPTGATGAHPLRVDVMIPEPATIALLSLGGLLLRRKK